MDASVFLRYSDLFDEKIPVQTLKKHLRRFKRSDIIHHLSRINALLASNAVFGSNKKEMQQLQYTFTHNYIDEQTFQERILPRFGRHNVDETPIFTRLSILYLIRLCILNCSENATLLAGGGTKGGFLLGLCCLIANDLIVTKKEEQVIQSGSNQKISKHLALQLSPVIELLNPVNLDSGIYRFDKLLFEIPESPEFIEYLAKEKIQSFDIAKEFESATGMSLREFRNISMGLMSFALHGKTENEDSYPTFGRTGFIEKSIISQQLFDSYLKLESASIDKLKGELAPSQENTNKPKLMSASAYLPLKSTPLVEIEPDFYSIADAAFVVEKFGLGSYWRILDSLGHEEKGQFQRFYGRLFEFYVNQILHKATSVNPSKRGIFLADPEYYYKKKEVHKSFDAMLYYPDQRHLIVFEHKGRLLKSESKYSGSITKFEQDLKKKFNWRSGKRPEGIAQIANHIERFFHADKDKRAHLCDDFFNSILPNVEKISPVLIPLEPFLQSHIIEGVFLNKYLQEEMASRQIIPGIKVNPLTVIQIEILESLKPYLEAGDITLERCLNIRFREDPEFRHEFHLSLFFKTGWLTENRFDEEVEEHYRKAMDETKLFWFGDTIEEEIFPVA